MREGPEGMVPKASSRERSERRFLKKVPRAFRERSESVASDFQEIPRAVHEERVAAQRGLSDRLPAPHAQVRAKLPNATISSDFISGFCGETEADHEETLSLLRNVRFDKAHHPKTSL